MRVINRYQINDFLRMIASAFMPSFIRRWFRANQRYYRLQWPRIGTVKKTGLWRVTPISRIFGLNRGLPIDRYYIEQFLSKNSKDIRGHVLEMGDDFYTKKFGGDGVTKSDALDVAYDSSVATVIADLTCADRVPSNTFDCIILVQTLQMIYDVRAALNHLYRILKPGGVLLVTSHGISKIGRREGIDRWGEYWRFTAQSSRRLFKEVFPDANISVKTYGNVLAAIAFLHGLAVEEMKREELDYFDADYEVLVTVRALKPVPRDTI